MTFDWSFLIGPIVGAIIGLITNGIAIRMLFRPLHPIKIGNFTLPFTPGLIPKEKPRIAKSVGEVVATQLVNAEVLEKGMLNKEIDEKIDNFITSFLEKYKYDHRTILELLEHYFSKEDVNYYVKMTETRIAEIAYQKAIDMNLGEFAMDAMNKEFERREIEDPSSIQFMPAIIGLIQPKIVELINDTVEKQGFFVIAQFVNQQSDEILSIPLSEIYAKSEKYIPQFKETVLKVYHFTVKNYLPGILKEIDIAKLVEDRINAFSLIELEKLLLDLMRKELNAIVYLGGLLGGIMGIIMNFF